MIFLRVVSKSEKKVEQVAELLLRKRLVIDVNVKRHAERAEMVNDELVTTPVYLLTAKTKATLFNQIDSILQEKYPDNMPEVYALPIVEMDWSQARTLRSMTT